MAADTMQFQLKALAIDGNRPEAFLALELSGLKVIESVAKGGCHGTLASGFNRISERSILVLRRHSGADFLRRGP
jgi:hypothetical protein